MAEHQSSGKVFSIQTSFNALLMISLYFDASIDPQDLFKWGVERVIASYRLDVVRLSDEALNMTG